MLLCEPMQSVRKLLRARRGGLLAVTVAYALAVQALMASVGLGMSAFAAPAHGELVLCAHVSTGVPAPGSEDQKPSPAPQCPFCFIAAHSAGTLALAGETPALPPYTALPLVLAGGHVDESLFVAQRLRTVGAPRAPPAFSV